MKKLLPALILVLFTIPSFAQECFEEFAKVRDVTRNQDEFSVKILGTYIEASDKAHDLGSILVQMAKVPELTIGSNYIADGFSKSLAGISFIQQEINNLVPAVEPSFKNLSACLQKCEAQVNESKIKYLAIVDYQKSTLPHFAMAEKAINDLLTAYRAAEAAGGVVPYTESQKLADTGDLLAPEIKNYAQKYDLLATDYYKSLYSIGTCSQGN